MVHAPIHWPKCLRSWQYPQHGHIPKIYVTFNLHMSVATILIHLKTNIYQGTHQAWKTTNNYIHQCLLFTWKPQGITFMRITWGAKYDHLPQKLPHETRVTSFSDNNHEKHAPITIWLGVCGIYGNSSITYEGAFVKQIPYKVEKPIHSNWTL